MAEELWNKVNIPFPSAVSSVRIPFRFPTNTTLKHLLGHNEKVLKLLCSELLQTEIRVLYELLYVLNNSFRHQKSFRVLKQVEQCINRLKEMKLDDALLSLRELCPTKAQRQLAREAGHCDVPSQPRLEWLCLKVLGATRLMGCLLNHCTRGFILTKQHLQCHEFILLNGVFTGMLSRLWVFFRGVLINLVPVYKYTLHLLKEVSKAQPMPFLREGTLPRDMAEFLGPADAAILKTELAKFRFVRKGRMWHRRFQEEGGEGRKLSQAGSTRRKRAKVDLGTAVLLQRTGVSGSVSGFDMKAWLKHTHGRVTEVPTEQEPSSSTDGSVIGQKRRFRKQVTSATTFSNMATQLQEVMQWCKSRKLRQERGRLAFLHLKCQRMKHLEAEGYSAKRKLMTYKQEVSWALSLCRTPPKTCQSLRTLWISAHPRIRCQSLRTQFRPIGTKACVNRKWSQRHRKRRTVLPTQTDPPEVAEIGVLIHQSSHTNKSMNSPDTPTQKPTGGNDDIDDIFATLGF